jgi:hypothetical protein
MAAGAVLTQQKKAPEGAKLHLDRGSPVRPFVREEGSGGKALRERKKREHRRSHN